MTTFHSSDKIWATHADPKDDVVPMGSYLGKAVLDNIQKRDPENVAEYNHDTEEAITFKDIYERTITVAMNLEDLKLGPNDVLAFFSRHNSFISSIAFGCYLNGTRWCPLDTIEEQLDYFIDYLKPTVLIYDKEFQAAVKKSLERLNFDVSIELVFGEPIAENSVEKVLLKPRKIEEFVPRDLSKIDSPDKLIACIVLTSGSTGLPKAALITHSMFVAQINVLSVTEEFNNNAVNMLALAAIRWVSQLYIMFIPTFFGAKKTFTGKDPRPDTVCDAIQKWKVTHLLSPNSMIHPILKHYKQTPGYDFTSLAVLLTGGEAPSPSTNSIFKELFPDLIISQGYGITECAGVVAIQNDLGYINGGHLKKGLSLKILNEDGENVEHDTPGLVCLKGRCPFPGYYNREEANKETYKDGWYITGDYGVMTEDNKLHIYCRYKNIPRCNGKLIIPGLVEDHLNKHHLVDLCIMIAVPGSSSENQKIAVFVQLIKGVDENEAAPELLQYLKEVVEEDIVAKFSIVSSFKTTTSGKADREILKEEFLA